MSKNKSTEDKVKVMITPERALEIIKSRSLQLIPIEKDNVIKWAVRTSKGTRAGGQNILYPTPEDAVEAAENWFISYASREQESKASRIIAALEKGTYFIRSREVLIPGDGGQQVSVRVFSAFLANGNATPIRDRSSFTQAVIDMENSLS